MSDSVLNAESVWVVIILMYCVNSLIFFFHFQNTSFMFMFKKFVFWDQKNKLDFYMLKTKIVIRNYFL